MFSEYLTALTVILNAGNLYLIRHIAKGTFQVKISKEIFKLFCKDIAMLPLWLKCNANAMLKYNIKMQNVEMPLRPSFCNTSHFCSAFGTVKTFIQMVVCRQSRNCIK